MSNFWTAILSGAFDLMARATGRVFVEAHVRTILVVLASVLAHAPSVEASFRRMDSVGSRAGNV